MRSRECYEDTEIWRSSFARSPNLRFPSLICLYEDYGQLRPRAELEAEWTEVGKEECDIILKVQSEKLAWWQMKKRNCQSLTPTSSALGGPKEMDHKLHRKHDSLHHTVITNIFGGFIFVLS